MNSLNWIEKFLSPLLKEELLEEIIGDLYEYKVQISKRNGFTRGVLLWFHAFQFIRPSLIKSFTGQTQLNTFGMLQLNLKIILRQFKKQRVITLNSILLLVISALCFQMIFSWLDNEWNRDRFHSKLDRIYLTSVKTNPTANLTSISLSTMFQVDYSQFPEVEQTMQVHIYGKKDAKLSAGDYDHWGKTLIADSNFFAFFDFEMVAGNATDVLYDPSNIVITQAYANLLFGAEDPLGKKVQLSCDQVGTYQIGAVLANLPSTSSIKFDILVPRHSQPFWRRIPQELVLSDQPLNTTLFNDKIKTLGRPTNTRFPESELSLTPLSSVYWERPFSTSLLDSYGNSSDLTNLSMMALILVIIGLLGFNHLQSTTVFSQHKKISIQQIMGSTKHQLWKEIFTSRILMGLIAILVTFLTYQLIFTAFTSTLGMSVDAQPLRDLFSIGTLILLMVFGSLIRARWQLYSIRVPDTLISQTRLFSIPRWQKAFSVIQFALSMSLLIIAAIILLQFQFLKKQKVGYHHEDIVAIDFFEMLGNYVSDQTREEARNNFRYLKDQLAQYSGIHSFSQGDQPFGHSINATSWKKAEETSEYTTQNMMIVDPAYSNLLDLQMIAGRFFSDSLDANNQQKVVINEAAAKYWNVENHSDTRLTSNTSGRQVHDFEILGIIKDYHYEHLSQEIKPLILRYRPYQDDQFLLRFQPGQQEAGLDYMETLFNEINPRGIYSYEVLSDQITAQYQQEERLGLIAGGFTLGALLLSSICLFTIAVHESQRRTKEIGIRKVLGASLQSIYQLQSRSFLYMIGIAFLLAIPLAYLFEQQWLTDYAMRITVGFWVYLGAGVVTCIIALLATGWQSLKLAKSNPVDSLRSE